MALHRETDDGVEHDISGRIARFLRTRDETELWPRTTAGGLSAARRAIERVVRASLGEPTFPASLDETPECDTRALAIAAFATGTGPLLAYWIAGGQLRASPALSALLAEQLEQNTRFSERVEREAVIALDALLAAGITPIAMKGFHTARTFWSAHGLRSSVDVDLVVRPDEIDAAEGALARNGFRATQPRRPPPYTRNWAPEGMRDVVFSVERPDARNPWNIDLHDSLDCDFRDVSRVRLDFARDRTAPFHVAGRVILAPVPALAALIASGHLGKELHSMRLARLIELSRIFRVNRDGQRMDWTEFAALVARSGAGRFVYPALTLVERLDPGSVDPKALSLSRDASGWIERAVVTRLVPAGGAPRKSVLETFMCSTGVFDLVRGIASRLVAGGLRPAVTRWAAIARQVRNGAITFGTSDDRSGTGSTSGTQ